MIKAVIFDCFGVLVGNSFWDIYAAAGGDLEKDADFIADIIYKANAGAISNTDFREAVSKQLGITPDEYRQFVDSKEKPNLPLFEYIRSDLKSDYKIALLSNVNRGVIERRIPADLRQLFDVEVVSGEVGFQKPDPEIFDLTLEKLGVKRDEVIFIDDREEYVVPARALGIQTIQYVDFPKFKAELQELLA